MPGRTSTLPHSDSLRDVLAVAPPSTLVPKRDPLQTRSSGAVLVHESAHHHHGAIQEHENETAEVVLVCEPEGTSLMMGGLHPRCAASHCVYNHIGLVLCLCLLPVIRPASLQTGQVSCLKELGRTKSCANLSCV